jgi:hypothetical protein
MASAILNRSTPGSRGLTSRPRRDQRSRNEQRHRTYGAWPAAPCNPDGAQQEGRPARSGCGRRCRDSAGTRRHGDSNATRSTGMPRDSPVLLGLSVCARAAGQADFDAAAGPPDRGGAVPGKLGGAPGGHERRAPEGRGPGLGRSRPHIDHGGTAPLASRGADALSGDRQAGRRWRASSDLVLC